MTWADILGAESKEFYNFGVSGGGNHQILIQLVETIKKFQIQKTDTVIIMWTSVCREDRFLKGSWLGVGNIYGDNLKNLYPKEFKENLTDNFGYLKRDLATISATKMILDQLDIDYHFLSMAPITKIAEFTDDKFEDLASQELIKLYDAELKSINSSVLEIVFDNNWFSSKLPRPRYNIKDSNGELKRDHHPSPYEHLEYIRQIFPNIAISEKTLNLIDESQKTLIF
jgi:hypothetical protein